MVRSISPTFKISTAKTNRVGQCQATVPGASSMLTMQTGEEVLLEQTITIKNHSQHFQGCNKICICHTCQDKLQLYLCPLKIEYVLHYYSAIINIAQQPDL